MKPFKTLDEQITILKGRGLNFHDEDEAKRYLLTNNYYNVINGYSKFFTTKRDHSVYIPTADFNEIAAVHLFDKELKNTILKALIEAEKHFKSIVAHRFSDKYRQPYSYLKTESYTSTNNWEEISGISKLIGSLSSIIKSNLYKKQMNSIKHYYKNYGDIPFWVLCNDMTFGQIITFFNYLEDDIKDSVARDLSTFLQSNIKHQTGQSVNFIISASTLSKFLNNANEFRNIAAHNNLIFGHRCWKNLPKQRWFPLSHRNCNPQGLYYVFLYLQGFLSVSQFSILHNSLRKRVITLSKKLHSIRVDKILKAIDFPANWHFTSSLPIPNTPQAIKQQSIEKIRNENRNVASKLRFKCKLK
ncbi:Abi family protein [Streptococcus suis]